LRERIIGFVKKTYGGISREVWFLASAMFINRCGSMVLLFMSVYLTQELHLSITQAGIVMSIWGLGSLCGAFSGGKLVDKFGYFPVLILSLLLSGSALIIISFIHTFIPLCIFVFIVTATGDSFRPANSMALMQFTKKENYAQSVALNRLAMNLGFSIAPILGGYLAKHNYPLLFIIDGVTCILACIFLYKFIPIIKNKFTKAETITEVNTSDSPYKDKIYLGFLVIALLYATCFFQFFTSIPLFFKTVCHFSEKSIGILYAMNGVIVSVCEMFLINYIKNKWSKLNFIALGIVLLAVAFGTLLISHSFIIAFVCIVLMSVSEMFAMPFMSDYSMQRAKINTTGQYLALYSMSWSVAQIAAPTFGTRIIDYAGFDTLWCFIVFLCFATFLYLYYMRNKFNQIN
jgi:predicted MFS family arabinose efflux permease